MSESSIDAYPLTWPVGWPRTDAHRRKPSLFAKHSMLQALNSVLGELRLLGTRQIVISINVMLRLDGLPRSGQKMPADPGAAVYFVLNGQPRVLACDRWTRVEDNLWAIGKHVEALRGQNRWGVGTIDQAFMGYDALPAPAVNWWEVLGVDRHASFDTIRDAYRDLAKRHHPDLGGSDEQFVRVQRAWEAGRKERGE